VIDFSFAVRLFMLPVGGTTPWFAGPKEIRADIEGLPCRLNVVIPKVK